MPNNLLNAVNNMHIATTPFASNPENLHPTSTITTNGLWSAQNQPTYALNFSQFLSSSSPEMNGGYDFNTFHPLEQCVLGGPTVGNFMFHPRDLLHLYSTPLSTPYALSGGLLPSPVDVWPREYSSSPEGALKPEVVIKEEVVRVVADKAVKVKRKKDTHLIKCSATKSPASNANHSCPQCDRKFTRRFNMMTHLKTHDKSRYV
jgi:hypothetical protein